MNGVTVRVPATTANLAAGFDTLGCALSLYNTLRFEESDTLSFSGCDAAYQNSDNLAYQGFAAVYGHIGKPAPGVHIGIQAEIPVSRGLGSSAALLAAGALAANRLSGAGLSPDTLIALTTRIEGHPDNLAPAFLGRLTASMMEDGQVFSVRYTPHPDLRFVVLSPDFPLSTHAARAVLPREVPHADAVYNCSRLAVLLRSLENGDMDAIAASLKDRLHQPYRFKLIDEYEDIRSLAARNGCGALCISGAGPTLLCLTRDASFADRMRQGCSALRHRWDIRDLKVDFSGAVIIEK